MKCALSHNFPPIRSGECGLQLLVRATLPCGRSCWGLLGILPEWRLLFRVAKRASPANLARVRLSDEAPCWDFPILRRRGASSSPLQLSMEHAHYQTAHHPPALLGGRVRNRANVDGGHRVLYNPRPSEPCDSRSLKVHHDFRILIHREKYKEVERSNRLTQR
jgi:hypothetical protein